MRCTHWRSAGEPPAVSMFRAVVAHRASGPRCKARYTPRFGERLLDSAVGGTVPGAGQSQRVADPRRQHRSVPVAQVGQDLATQCPCALHAVEDQEREHFQASGPRERHDLADPLKGQPRPAHGHQSGWVFTGCGDEPRPESSGGRRCNVAGALHQCPGLQESREGVADARIAMPNPIAQRMGRPDRAAQPQGLVGNALKHAVGSRATTHEHQRPGLADVCTPPGLWRRAGADAVHVSAPMCRDTSAMRSHSPAAAAAEGWSASTVRQHSARMTRPKPNPTKARRRWVSSIMTVPPLQSHGAGRGRKACRITRPRQGSFS